MGSKIGVIKGHAKRIGITYDEYERLRSKGSMGFALRVKREDAELKGLPQSAIL